MRRLALSALLIAALAAGVLATTGAKHDPNEDPRYWVTMDNAFGLIEGADVKVAGVRAGQIESFRIEPKTYRALVEIRIGKKGFGDLRKDVHCESRPQSLIGEYFIDCLPGTSKQELPEGSVIPVERTAIPVPVEQLLLHMDELVRSLDRESLRTVVDELGVKPKEVFQPVRVALTGTTVSPGIFESVATLGREETLARIDEALARAEQG